MAIGLADFDHAIGNRDVERAGRFARTIPDLPLDRALRLILLQAEKQSDDFEPAVRRFIVRFIQEFKPRPLQIRKLADCFECLETWFLGPEAKAGLEQLAARLCQHYEGRRPRTAVANFAFNGKVERLEWNP